MKRCFQNNITTGFSYKEKLVHIQNSWQFLWDCLPCHANVGLCAWDPSASIMLAISQYGCVCTECLHHLKHRYTVQPQTLQGRIRQTPQLSCYLQS